MLPSALPAGRRLQFIAPWAVALAVLGGSLVLWVLSSGPHGVAVPGIASWKSPGIFVDATDASGIVFVHDNGTTGELLLPEIMGAGGALFDYDNDGDLDLFVVQGTALRAGRREGASSPALPKGGRLYRNDLEAQPDGTRSVRFVDVTERSGIVARGFGMGATTGDYDNDGCIDLYLTNLGPNQLLHNNCDGTFTDVTAKSGTDDPRWSMSATFFDYDRDGWLDLFVTNYVEFSVDMKRECFSRHSTPDYCSPASFTPVTARLFHNEGDGTFSDVTARSAVTQTPAAGLGVVAIDVNGDGWTDLYVANDGYPNQLLINEHGSGVFSDRGLSAGVALNRTGQAQGSMGVDAGDVDGDGNEDLFVTNLDHESSTLYLSRGAGLFEDRTIEAGLLAPSLGFTGFGTRFVDYDNDGWLDLLVVNGSVRITENRIRQHNQLFRNDGRGTFIDVSASAGPAFDLHEISRGAAFGDLDNDGDTDVVVFNNAGPLRVLLNQVGSRAHWLGVRVVDDRYRRDAVQARVAIVRPEGGLLWRRVQTDGSYLASSDPRVLFGLGNDASRQTVRVYWVGRQAEDFPDLAVDRYWVLQSGRAPRAP